MKIQQVIVNDPRQLAHAAATLKLIEPHVVLVFGAPGWFSQPDFLAHLEQGLGQTTTCGCSTAGELSTRGVSDGDCVLTALRFSGGPGQLVSTESSGLTDSKAAGERLAAQVKCSSPARVLLFGPGVHINGSALVDGLLGGLPAGSRVFGGLAGDGTAFKRTWSLADGVAFSRGVVAYLLPESVEVHSSSVGGWVPFGAPLKVTRAAGSLLLELNGEPALAVYKRFLGTFAKDLPSSGLLFPFEVLRADQSPTGIIRTILGVSESDGSLALAGSVEAPSLVRLMQASHDALVEGAQKAALASTGGHEASAAERFALLISCVGRKLVLGRRVDDEVKTVLHELGPGATLAGFYSYGEIGPGGDLGGCHLFNQTMTVAHIVERGA